VLAIEKRVARRVGRDAREDQKIEPGVNLGGQMANADLANELTSIGDIIGAVAALGTAAYGLVDISKFWDGGISNAGYQYVLDALKPFEPALVVGGGPNWAQTLRAHWINGMEKDDQKSVAKSLIRLGLSAANAPSLAAAGGVAAPALTDVVTKLDNGTALSPADINVLGRFDSMVDARLDGGYERADQRYRNVSKAVAASIAVALALLGEFVIAQTQTDSDPMGYLLAVLVGLVAVPLAPVAKDLSSAIGTAVKALKASGA